MTKTPVLLKIAVAVFGFWVVAQIAIIFYYWGTPQFTDMGEYISLATRCFNSREWYPMNEDVYSDFIWAPGYINYLILQLYVFKTVNINPILNLFLNIAMLFEVYYLGKKFFSTRVGLLSAILFCLTLSNLFIVSGAYTEIPFTFLCLSALCLVFSGKLKYVICAAPLFALANWIRPLVVVFLFVTLAYFIFTRVKFYNYVALFIPYALILFLIGSATEKKIGHFVYQSTTSGYNLLITTGNDAKGVHVPINEKGGMLVENSDSVTFAERDSIWKGRAWMWIKQHPMKFAVLYCLKIPTLYTHDAWMHMAHYDASTQLRLYKLFDSGSSAASKWQIIKQTMGNMLQSIPYYLSLLFFAYAIWVDRKGLLSVRSVFLAIFIVGTLATCVYNISFRYHYPYMFAVIIYAAYGLHTFIEKKNFKC